MLARSGPQALLVIVLQGGVAGAQKIRHRMQPLATAAAQSACERVLALLGASLSEAGGTPLRRAPQAQTQTQTPADFSAATAAATSAATVVASADAASAAVPAAAAVAAPSCTPEQAISIAHACYGDVVEHALLPVLDELAATGCRDVALVPSGDLHLLPWLDAVGDRLTDGMRLVQYPNAGAWARWTLAPPADSAAAAEEPLRWALLAADKGAAAPPLQWAGLEQALAQRLLQSHGAPSLRRPQDTSFDMHGVNAVLAIGHGAAPLGNMARAGLLLADGHVFSAHDLPRIHSARCVLMSCCVLGCIDEVMGEAMGFLSSSLGYDTHFGCGWLLEVPDAEACLFSLALQYALCRAAPPIDWLATFESVRQGIRRGQWPPGFGPWLAGELPRAVAAAGYEPGPWLNRYALLRDFDGGMFNVPPPSLCRLVPWVVGLGR